MTEHDGRLRSGTLYYYSDVAAHALISRFVLRNPVDGEALNRAVSETVKQHPYITKSLREQNGCFYPVDNTNPMPVLHTTEDLILGSKTAGGHLYGITWYENRLNLYFFHGLIDGMAAQWVMETLLYYYFSYKNDTLYPHEGIRINDGTVYEGSDAEPFAAAYDIGTEGDEERSARPVIPDRILHLTELDAGFHKNEHTGFEVRVDSAAFMELVKREKLTPASAAAVFLSRAAMRLVPDNTLPVKTAVPVNIRHAIGMDHTYKNATLDVGLYFDPREMDDLSIGEQGRILRAQLKAQTTSVELRTKANATIDWLRRFEEAGSYEGCLETFNRMERPPVDTFLLSYVGRLHLSEYEDEVQEVSLVSHSRNSIIIDLTEMGGDFIFGFRQCVPSPFFVDAFTEVLCEHGIPATHSDGTPYTLPRVFFK